MHVFICLFVYHFLLLGIFIIVYSAKAFIEPVNRRQRGPAV